MRAFITVLSVFLALSLLAQEADAKKRKRRKGRARKAKVQLKATKQTRMGINRLMGKFKWGVSSEKVLTQLEDRVRKEMEPGVRATQDPLEQDKKRREMLAKIKNVRKNFVQFTGKRTPWDVSLVDKEFAHKNNESMAVSWEKMERRFYFFHHDRLWKIFIAFNADLFSGKSFEDFALAMEKRFGRAERKYSVTLTGDQKMDHMAWPESGKTLMLAYDLTGFYGNFCLVLLNTQTFENVKHGRELNSPKRDYRDPLIEAVTSGGEEARDPEEDVVDRITGKGVSAPSVTDSSPSYTPPSSSGSSGGSDYPDEPPKKKRKKRVDPKNPLDGLDI